MRREITAPPGIRRRTRLHAQLVRRLVEEREEAARRRLEVGVEQRLRRLPQRVPILGAGDQRPVHHDLHGAQHAGVDRRPEPGEDLPEPRLARQLGRRQRGEPAVVTACRVAGIGRQAGAPPHCARVARATPRSGSRLCSASR
jgi:hypothetical protein